jgi:hypothetical protein
LAHLRSNGRRRRRDEGAQVGVQPHGAPVVTFDPLHLAAEPRELAYTHLFACISEEDDGYIVQVRLYNQPISQDAAWGEEIADSIEMASALIATIADKFSIPQERIKLELRMANIADNTQH